MQIDQGEDGEEGGNYKAQNQFHTHLKKQEVRNDHSLLLTYGRGWKSNPLL